MNAKCDRMTITPKHQTLIGTLMTISFFSALLMVFFCINAPPPTYQFAIMVDAGSTHSKVVLFRWRTEKRNGTGLVEEVDSCHHDTGITAYAASGKIGNSAQGIADCIRKVSPANNIPPKDLRVYLIATGGMRLLQMHDNHTAMRIFDTLREKLSSWNLQKIITMSGTDEGLFAWVTVNYLKGKFNRTNNSTIERPEATLGVLDMGGSSAQIAQQAYRNKDDTDLAHITLYGHNYSVHSFSNLCFGADQALYRYLKLVVSEHRRTNPHNRQIRVPCLPANFEIHLSKISFESPCTVMLNGEKIFDTDYVLVGTSDVGKCHQLVGQMLDSKQCKRTFRYCFEESLEAKTDTFYAISAYNYLAQVLRDRAEGGEVSLEKYVQETNKICSSSKAQLEGNSYIKQKYLHKYCFQLSYIFRTLINVYHFSPETWPNLRFTNSVNGTSLGWSLGYMINETNSMPVDFHFLDNWYPIAFLVFFVLFIITGVLFINNLNVMRQQRRTIPSQMTLAQAI